MIRYKIDISQKECDALIEMQLKHSVSTWNTKFLQNRADYFGNCVAVLYISSPDKPRNLKFWES